MRNNMFKTWLLIVFLAICGTTSFASCSYDDEHPSATPTIDSIRQRGKILVGTTGDYRPLSFREADGTYWGYGIEMAREIAAQIGVDIEFVKTSWPTLSADVLAEPQMFDLAMGGITITDARRETMLMSEGIWRMARRSSVVPPRLIAFSHCPISINRVCASW